MPAVCNCWNISTREFWLALPELKKGYSGLGVQDRGVSSHKDPSVGVLDTRTTSRFWRQLKTVRNRPCTILIAWIIGVNP